MWDTYLDDTCLDDTCLDDTCLDDTWIDKTSTSFILGQNKVYLTWHNDKVIVQLLRLSRDYHRVIGL